MVVPCFKVFLFLELMDPVNVISGGVKAVGGCTVNCIPTLQGETGGWQKVKEVLQWVYVVK